MIEALMSAYAAITNAIINVIGFVYTLLQEHNYIALAAILVALIIIGAAIGLVKRKLKRSR